MRSRSRFVAGSGDGFGRTASSAGTSGRVPRQFWRASGSRSSGSTPTAALICVRRRQRCDSRDRRYAAGGGHAPSGPSGGGTRSGAIAADPNIPHAVGLAALALPRRSAFKVDSEPIHAAAVWSQERQMPHQSRGRVGKDVKEATDVWIEARSSGAIFPRRLNFEVLRNGWCAPRVRQPDGRPWHHVWRARGWITGLVRLCPPAAAGRDSRRSDPAKQP